MIGSLTQTTQAAAYALQYWAWIVDEVHINLGTIRHIEVYYSTIN